MHYSRWNRHGDVTVTLYERHGEGTEMTRLYRAWASMKARCFNPTSTSYPWYGSKGITVCDEWRDSFIAFRDWALANGYDPDADDLSIDRIDPTDNYHPGNCEWVSMDENRRRRRQKVN